MKIELPLFAFPGETIDKKLSHYLEFFEDYYIYKLSYQSTLDITIMYINPEDDEDEEDNELEEIQDKVKDSQTLLRKRTDISGVDLILNTENPEQTLWDITLNHHGSSPTTISIKKGSEAGELFKTCCDYYLNKLDLKTNI